MSRTEELTFLMQELEENTPDLSPILKKAKRKRAVDRLAVRPLICFLAVFSVFVFMINVSAPVASACSQVPILRELAKALAIRPALSEAVDNDHVQQMDVPQSDGEMTATIEYIIADEMQTNVVFRLDPDMEPLMEAEGTLYCDTFTCKFVCDWTKFIELGDGYYLMSLDNLEKKMVYRMEIKLHLYDGENLNAEYFWKMEGSREHIADLSFDVELEEEFYGKKKVYIIDQPLLIDDQKFTVSGVSVYPTVSVIDLEEDPGNTAWLGDMTFYLETDDGSHFGKPKYGLFSATQGSKSALTYRAESPYFREMKELKLVITGVRLVQKDDIRPYVDLATGETRDLPEGVTLISTEKQGGEWLLTIRIDKQTGSGKSVRLGFQCFDPDGERSDVQYAWKEEGSDADGEIAYDIYTLRVGRPDSPYLYDEVWLSFEQYQYHSLEEPLVYTIPLEAEGS